MGAMFYISITILVWGIAAIVDKLALNKGEPFVGLTIRGIAIFTALISLTIFTGKTRAVISFIQNDTRTTLLFALSGLLAGVIGMLTYYAAIKLAPVSQIVPLGATYPLVAVLLGVFLLKEHLSLVRLIGILLIIGGVYLVHLPAIRQG